MTLGRAVRARREQRGWTQQELAARAGVSEATIQNLEGDRTNRPSSLPRVADALGTTVERLRAGEVDDQQPPEVDEVKLAALLDDVARANDALRRFFDRQRGHGESSGTR